MMPFRALKTAKKCHPRYEYELADPEPRLMSFAISYLRIAIEGLRSASNMHIKKLQDRKPNFIPAPAGTRRPRGFRS